MIPKKSGGQIIGAHLTNAEKKAMDIEIRKQVAEQTRQIEIDIYATFLSYLHTKHGYGPEGLKNAFFELEPMINNLCKHYEMAGRDDRAWLCTRQLEEIGADISKWHDEFEKMG